MADKVQFDYFNGRTKMVTPQTAKLLHRINRGTYETRDLRAGPATASTEGAFDSAGVVYNPEIHASTRSLNNDGTWRKKPGAAAQE
jgi:hypothetical protein